MFGPQSNLMLTRRCGSALVRSSLVSWDACSCQWRGTCTARRPAARTATARSRSLAPATDGAPCSQLLSGLQVLRRARMPRCGFATRLRSRCCSLRRSSRPSDPRAAPYHRWSYSKPTATSIDNSHWYKLCILVVEDCCGSFFFISKKTEEYENGFALVSLQHSIHFSHSTYRSCHLATQYLLLFLVHTIRKAQKN